MKNAVPAWLMLIFVAFLLTAYPAYSQPLKGAVRAEVDKDFVKMPVHEIEKHLTGG